MQNDFNTPSQAALDMEREIASQKFYGHYLAVKNAANIFLCKNAPGTLTIAADRRGVVQLVSVLMRCGAY